MNIEIKVRLLKMCENFLTSCEISSEQLLRAANCVAYTCVKDPHMCASARAHARTHLGEILIYVCVPKRTAQIYYQYNSPHLLGFIHASAP